MGFSRERVRRAGKPRYTAHYKDIRGRERSAGTFSNRKDADRAWQRAEAKQAEGLVGDSARGRMTFQLYVEGVVRNPPAHFEGFPSDVLVRGADL